MGLVFFFFFLSCSKKKLLFGLHYLLFSVDVVLCASLEFFPLVLHYMLFVLHRLRRGGCKEFAIHGVDGW